MKDLKFKEPASIENLINSKSIFPVFQPVLSIQNASVIGYESFMRFDLDKENLENPSFLPENAFEYEKEKNNVWILDKACFKTAVKTARAIGLRKKLFINLNSASFFDKNFQKEYIFKSLQKYGIEPSSVVIEISENNSDEKLQEKIEETAAFFRSNGCQIALDNFGRQNFGFKKIYSLNPNYIKIDRTVIQNISTDEIKQKMVKSLVSFCSEIGTKIVAAGVETEAELKTLICLGVDFAQGFFIGKPDRIFKNASNSAYSLASKFLYKENSKTEKEQAEKKSDKNKKTKTAAATEKRAEIAAPQKKQGAAKIGDFCFYGATFVSETPVPEVLQIFQINKDCQLAVVVDMENRILGTISKSKFLNLFTSQYGYDLYSRRTIGHLMEKDFFSADENESVIEVSEKAMLRNEETVYSPIVVESHGKYKGIVSVRKLLDTIVNVEVAEKTKDLMLKNKILTKQRQIQLRDMKMAELVQKSFYKSKAPALKDWECAFYFKPMASVSGDVYDFYVSKKEEKFLGCSLFDVSGHGVASGLVGILSKYLASQTFKNGKNLKLDELLRNFNKSLTEAKGMVENYLTGVFIRTDGNKLEYVNAGHPDIFIKNGGEKTKILGTGVKNFRGSFIGIEGLPDDFKTVEEKIEPDSYILLYTDCLVESRNLMGFELEQNSLMKIFDRACSSVSPDTAKKTESVLNSIISSFESFTEGVPLKDDLTVIVLHYR